MSKTKSIAAALMLVFGIANLAGTSAMAGTACTCAGNVTDNFDDNVITWLPSASCFGTAVEALQTLRLIKGNCTGEAKARLEPTLCSDFDAQMDYSLFNWSSLVGGSRLTGLRVTTTGGTIVGGIERHQTINTGGCAPTSAYKAYASDTSSCAATWTPTGHFSGKFRIARQGLTLKLSYWNASGSVWVELLSTPVTGDELYLFAHAESELDGGTFAVAGDNFVLTSESCPTPARAASWGEIKGTYR
jgi:hypothetical protein